MQMSLWRNADRNIIQLAHWPQCAPSLQPTPQWFSPFPGGRFGQVKGSWWPAVNVDRMICISNGPQMATAHIHTHTYIEWLVQTFIANCRKDICINLTKPKVFHVGKQTNDNLTTHTHKCTGQQASSRRWAVVARRGRGTCNLPANRADHQHPNPPKNPTHPQL